MAERKYTMEQKLAIGKETYETILRDGFSDEVFLILSCKYNVALNSIRENMRMYRKGILEPKPTPEEEKVFAQKRKEYLAKVNKKALETKQPKIVEENLMKVNAIIEDFMESAEFVASRFILERYKTVDSFKNIIDRFENGTEEEQAAYKAYQALAAERREQYITVLRNLIAKLSEGFDIAENHVKFLPIDFFTMYNIPLSSFRSAFYTICAKNTNNILTAKEHTQIEKFIALCDLTRADVIVPEENLKTVTLSYNRRNATPSEIEYLIGYLKDNNIPLNSANLMNAFERYSKGLLIKKTLSLPE